MILISYIFYFGYIINWANRLNLLSASINEYLNMFNLAVYFFCHIIFHFWKEINIKSNYFKVNKHKLKLICLFFLYIYPLWNTIMIVKRESNIDSKFFS